MRGKHIFLMLVIVLLVGVYSVAMSAEVTNVVVRPGWAPDAQGGPTSKTVLIASRIQAAKYDGYQSLDSTEPIFFDGERVEWNGKVFLLDENTIFLDYRLDSEQIKDNPYAFNNIQAAAKALKHGTPQKPMLLLTAPGVYWVDDPDDPEIRRGAQGLPPFGMTIACDYLYFYGLNSTADNIVFAVNRGQTQGASGNFTMFSIQGVGLRSENVTFGNYCNVDLEFPLDPSLSRKKRSEAIAQAQLFYYSGNDGIAINTNFISRLNLLPFATTYLNCHLESSGHASFYNGIYIGCSFEFYGANFASGKFFDCDIYITPFVSNYQGKSTYYFGFVDGTEAGGVCIDTRFYRSKEMIDNNIALEISWDRIPQSATTRGYQHNVTLDGKPYVIQEVATPGATVIIDEGSELLKAFKVEHGGQTYYNIPNITSGKDPFGYVDVIKAAARANGKDENYYLNIPYAASLRLDSNTIRSGQSIATMTYSVQSGSLESSQALGGWTFTASDPAMVEIIPNADQTITVSGTNNTTEPVDVIIIAKNQLGIEAAARITVEPAYLETPTVTQDPVIKPPADGYVELHYELSSDADLGDHSLISWYRTTDPASSQPFKVAVSRLDQPETAYKLSEGDIGYYLAATIAPKHKLSDTGKSVTVYSSFKIREQDVVDRSINTNFKNLPTDPQPQIIPGTWTLDGYFSPECYDDKGKPRYTANSNSWTYDAGEAGSKDYYGLNQTARGARLFYTPSPRDYQGMTVRARFAPDKSAGQGFGSATDQFLDVFIKFDLETMTGYALRIQRFSADEINAIGFNGDGAVAGCAFFLVEYRDGITTVISDKIMSSAFLSECTVELTAKDNRLLASVTSTAGNRSGDQFDFPREVHFDIPIAGNGYGGTGMLFTGTVGSNSVLVTGWETYWD